MTRCRGDRRVPGRAPRLALAALACLLALAASCSSESDSEATRTTSTTATSISGTDSSADPGDPAGGGATRPELSTPVRLVDPGIDLDEAIAASSVPGTMAMVVAERHGVLHEVRVHDGGAALVEPPLLDLRERVGDSSGERGLLGVAISPEAAYVVVSYTAAADGSSRIERYDLALEPDGLRVDEGTRRELLRVDQPYSNHNGGHVVFGPDGMLYLGLGDGGSGGDPQGHAQDPASLLGKLLRLDPEAPSGIPEDNPFVDDDVARPEIWATGLRNPWRFSFDADTGDLWIADVGQNAWEEINVLPAADGAGRGANLGWDLFEGAAPFDDADPAPSPWSDGPFVEPLHVYGRDDGCSITGGLVYRGSALPSLRGAYLFADFCGTGVRALDPAAPGSFVELDGGELDEIVAFVEGPEGAVLVISLSAGLRLLAAP